MDIARPLGELEWIPKPRVTALRRLGIERVEDLLTHYPRRYEDRQEFPEFPHEESDKPVCLCGEVVKTQIRRFGGWKKIFEVTLEETNATALSQPLTLRWFNLHYVQKMIATGQRLIVFGKPRLRGKRLCLDHPEFEVIEPDEDEASIHFRRITPVYPATEGVSQRLLRGIIYRVLQELSDEPLDTLAPARLVKGDRRFALQAIHFPETWEQKKQARHHLVLSEFFALQMLIAARRSESEARPGAIHCGKGALLEKFIEQLPFGLTDAQKKVIEEIKSGLAARHPMNRLLQGDVGSGKTVVAIAAILLTVEAGFQATMMAPTQILAEQHYDVLRRWLEPLGVRVALRTSARQEESGPLPLFELAAGNASDPGSAGCQPAASGSLPDESQSGASAADIRYRRRRLPHFERPWAKYMITFSTRGRRQLCPKSKETVMESVLRWKDRRYELFAACVMPDHVHLLLEPAIEKDDKSANPQFFSLSKILHSIKSYTATRINRIDECEEPVWEAESFDRLIRSEADLREKFEYITRNPWDTGVVGPTEEYPWVWYSGLGEDNSNIAAGCRDEQAGSLRSPEKARRGNGIPSDAPHVIVGTHALLYDSVSFENLGLVVIDEQHKFGVAQRARLTAREPAPDVLVMTATPIPRTLTMTAYGDLDVSVIDEMPRNRGKIVTAVRDPEKLDEVLAFLRKELTAGRQAYVIYPLIDESEKLNAKAAAVEYERWSKCLAPFSCALLHGRIPAPEKQEIMEQFRTGKIKVLVSTTVIEVGVDVANATVMLVENAERFGLAQLHQLRGRIGRGEHKSYCVLLSSDLAAETQEKLGVLVKTANGFEIAEADWQMRGPGDLLGTAQSGLPALKIGDLREDSDLMQQARAAATLIFEKDPQLEWAENQRFRQLIVEQQGRTFANVS
jgi:RecG-like helicase/REP element-mobilizing transposase RayT